MEATLRHSSAPRNHVRPTLVYAAAFFLAAGIDVAYPLRMDGGGAGLVQQAIGGSALGAGLALVVWCLILFRRLGTGIMPDRPATRLVTTGPYGRSRHPMFVGFTSMYVGLALLLNLTWPLLLLPVVLIVLALTVIRCEEGYMRRTFGTAYDRYAARVPRWL
jgi:protein-S-isoprenylcysteine O-methyltransferase Ste14